jgi:hypothetical protein
MKFDIYEILSTPTFWLAFYVFATIYVAYETLEQGLITFI